MEKGKILFLVFIFGVLLVSIPGVFAFGVSTPYYLGHPLELSPGERTSFLINLQNCAWLGDECEVKEVIVDTEILEGGKIVKIKGNGNFAVPYGSPVIGDEIYVPIYVKVPKNANVGDSYFVEILFKEKDPSGFLSVAYHIKFYVNIV